MRSAVAFVAGTPLLSGCASYSWYNPNVPPEIAERDSEECRQQAAYLVNTTLMANDPFWLAPDPLRWGPPVSGLALEQDMYRRCMTSKGYALVKDQPGRPAGPP